MLLNYIEEETFALENIGYHFKAQLDKVFTEYANAEAEFKKLNKKAQQGKRPLTVEETRIVAEFERTQSAYSDLLAEYEEQRKAITNQAEAREEKYFAEHIDELAEKLKSRIEGDIASLGLFAQDKDTNILKSIYENDAEIKHYIRIIYGRYLDVLKERGREDDYQQVISFIDSSIADKERIAHAHMPQNPFRPAKSSRLDETYMYMAQNNATNYFNKVARLVSTRGILQQWGGMLTYKQEDLTIGLPHYEQLVQNSNMSKSDELSTPLKKVLDIAIVIFTNNGHNPSITFSLEEYMTHCGLTDKKEARRQVNSALEVLYDISISYDDSKNKNRSKNYRDMRLVDDKGIKNGIVYLHIAHGFAEMLSACPVMPFPMSILTASKGREKRNAYYIGRKIMEHKNMNVGKRNENIISVRALLEAAPFLATVDEVKNSDRRLNDRIIMPFLADLEQACVSLDLGSEGYELQYAGGTAIPKDELVNLNYETFINAYVRFDEPPKYPDQTRRLEAKAARTQDAKETQKKKAQDKQKS